MTQRKNIPAAGLLLLLLMLCFSTRTFAIELEKDTVYLRDGEVLVGDIRELRLGLLSFNSKDVGIISLKLSKIKTINSSSDTLRVETANKDIYYGAIKPSDKEGWVYVVTESHRHHIEISNINSLILFRKRFWDNLSGNVSAGFSYSHSSGIGQLTTSYSVTYAARRYDVTFSGSGIGSIDTSKFSRDREDLDLSILYNIEGAWYGVASLDYQRNLQLSIARRFQQLVAGGYKFIFSPNFQIMGMGGLSVSQERSTTGEEQNFLCELPAGFSLDFFRFSHPNMQITSSHTFYTGLTQWGRVRYDGSTTIAWTLIEFLNLSFNLYMNYDSRPPDTSAGKTDYGTVISLSYRF